MSKPSLNARTLHIDPSRFRSCPLPGQPVRLHGDLLQLVLAEGIGARDLLPAIAGSSRGRSRRSRWLTLGLVELAGIALTSLALMITLGVFDIFGNALHHVVGSYVAHEAAAGHDETARELVLLVGSMVAMVVGLTLIRVFRRVPLFEENVESVGHSVRMAFDDFFNSDSHLRGALRGRLRRAGVDRARRIEVWNANANDTASVDGGDGVIWRILLPALLETSEPDVVITLLVRSDEYDAVAGKVAARLPGMRVERITAVPEVPAGLPAAALLPPIEREWLPMLRLAAFPAANITGDTLAADATDHVFCETHFINLSKLVRGADAQRARAFLRRCRSDYGFLVDGGQGRYPGFHPDFLKMPFAETMPALRSAAQHTLMREPRSFLDPHDPLSHIAVLNGLCSAAAQRASAGDAYRLAQTILAVVAGFLECVEENDRYDVVKHFFGQGRDGNLKAVASCLPAVVGAGDESGNGRLVREEVRRLTRFNAFGYEALTRLGRVHEVVGNYAEALAVWQKLEAIDGRRARVRIARLSERGGDFVAAADCIGAAIGDLERQPSVHAVGNSALLAVETYLEGAWIIVSAAAAGQQKECRRRLEQAERWLGQLDQVADPLIYWRYFNYLGLYHDWCRAYPEALAQHRRALAIPGVSDKWYSGSLVNLAYVQRKAALSRPGARAAMAAELETAQTYAALAVDLKRRIGDEDELPVALHNLALAGLCRILAAPAETTADAVASHAAECASVAREGLAILDRLGSNKKRFALLLELWLAERLCHRDGREVTLALRALSGLSGVEADCVVRLDEANAAGFVGDRIVALQLLT